MVKVNGLAMWLLLSLCSAKERSILGKKISKADHIRVQATRLNRMEERMEQMSADGLFLAESTRHHREMRIKGNSELKGKVEDLKDQLHHERDRMQKEFDAKLAKVREDMDAKAARDRDALKAELGQKKKGGRRDLSEEAREHADKMVQEVKTKLEEQAERDRELYAQRAALAEEGQKLAHQERKQLQEEKDEVLQQLQETVDVESANRRKIILKFKARENTLRRNFERELREALTTGGGEAGSARSNEIYKRPRATKPMTPSTMSSSRRAAVQTPGGSSDGEEVTSSSGTSAAQTPQR